MDKCSVTWVTCDLRAPIVILPLILRSARERDDQKDNCGMLVTAQGLSQGCKHVNLAEC